MSKRPHYDDKFRASAVVMLEAAGYPTRKGALEQVARTLDMQPRTLSRWFNKEQNPPPDQVVSEKASDLKMFLRREIDGILKEMPSARDSASYRDLGTVLGILVDKLQLLEEKPTERVAVEYGLSDAERASRIAALLDGARARRDGRAADSEFLQ